MKTSALKLTVQPLWTSYMQCFKAISDYLKLGHSTAEIFGATGHAFILNIHPELCPSSVTCFFAEPLDERARNLGFSVHTTIFAQSFEDFGQQQKEIWEAAKTFLDKGKPLIGWDLQIPEYYIINGYDKENYLFYDLKGQPQKVKWNKLGKGETTIANIKRIEQEDTVADLNKTLKDAFSMALDFARGKKEWVFPGYFSGKKAYAAWIEALQSGKGNHFGAVYNAHVWAECKSYGNLFLRETKKKLKSKLLDKLIEHYDVLTWSHQKVADIYTPDKEKYTSEEIETAVDALFLAQEADKAALAEMKSLISQL